MKKCLKKQYGTNFPEQKKHWIAEPDKLSSIPTVTHQTVHFGMICVPNLNHNPNKERKKKRKKKKQTF